MPRTSLLHTPLYGERRPPTDCSCMRNIVVYFSRKISHKTFYQKIILNESTTGADASVKVQRHEATRSS